MLVSAALTREREEARAALWWVFCERRRWTKRRVLTVSSCIMSPTEQCPMREMCADVLSASRCRRVSMLSRTGMTLARSATAFRQLPSAVNDLRDLKFSEEKKSQRPSIFAISSHYRAELLRMWKPLARLHDFSVRGRLPAACASGVAVGKLDYEELGPCVRAHRDNAVSARLADSLKVSSAVDLSCTRLLLGMSA